MNFSKAYRIALTSGVFEVRNGAPVAVFRLRQGQRVELFKPPESKPKQAKPLEQIINEGASKGPVELTEEKLLSLQTPRALAHDLAKIILDHHLGKSGRIDFESIVEAGVKDELSSLPESLKAVAEKHRWSRGMARERLPQIQRTTKTPRATLAVEYLFLPCIEAFKRHLGVGTDAAYRYTAIFISGAGIVKGDAVQIYSRIKTGIHRSKPRAKTVNER